MSGIRGQVWLVTSAQFAQGEPGSPVLDAALAARGIDARWVRWDDVSLDWRTPDLIAVRSTWDYVTRIEKFLSWSRALPVGRLLNSAKLFVWNHDKAYLAELVVSGEVPTVPTWVADSEARVRAAVERVGVAVVKPAVGAGGDGLLVVSDGADPRLRDLPGHRWVVQPLVESVRSDGESSIFVLDGEVTSQVDKWPGGGEVRVHEHRGGRSRRVGVDPVRAEVARSAYDWVARRFPGRVDYLRVDLLHVDRQWSVSELELIEPGLYLDVTADNAEPFARLVAKRLAEPAAASLD